MLVTYEDALFYKLLSQIGYEKDVDDWITSICNENERLEGVHLDLAYCQGKNNAIISCLHNYIGDNQVDNQIVQTRLRLFILEKLNQNEITIDFATTSLIRLSKVVGDCGFDIWFDFYLVGEYFDFVDEGTVKKEEFDAEIRHYLETGKHLFREPDSSREKTKKSSTKMNLGKKMKLYWFIFGFICLIIIFLYILFK